MAERLTKEYYYTWDENGTKKLSYIQKLQNKLGKLEDILEKYGIESVEELENIIINGLAMLDIQKINILKEMELKTDRDTWKKACELACDVILRFTDGCPCKADYFYQQAKKKEGENK